MDVGVGVYGCRCVWVWVCMWGCLWVWVCMGVGGCGCPGRWARGIFFSVLIICICIFFFSHYQKSVCLLIVIISLNAFDAAMMFFYIFSFNQ